jgi:hypothetical protein
VTRVTSWLLVHPPLLGPAVLRPLAAELRARGDAVAVPDLRNTVAVAAGWPARYVAAAARPADAVLGFSGAGVVLPGVARACGARRVVWLDALVPARSGATHSSAEHRARIAPLVSGGRIAEWTTWWGPDGWAELVPDAELRAAVAAEGHRLPADFYEEAVPVPREWPEEGAEYVQLSAAYDGDAAQAQARGWRGGGRRDGAHLDVATDPAGVLALIG